MIVPAWSVHQGDCLEYLRTLPSDSVHCCVTSPPYWGLRDYGVDGQIGLEASLQEYLAILVDVFREVRRVLRPDGTCWVNLGDAYANAGKSGLHVKGASSNLGGTPNHAHMHSEKIPDGLKPKDLMMLPSRIALALQADGWWLRSEIIWAKPNPMPESITDRPTCAHEKVFLLAKSARYFYDADAVREPHKREWNPENNGGSIGKRGSNYLLGAHGKDRTCPVPAQKNPSGANKRNVWTIPTEAFPDAHFATFPRRLVEPCVKAGTSEKGCCPECGAPWKRVVEVDRKPDTYYVTGKSAAKRGMGLNTACSGYGPGGPPSRQTTGWRPTCSCPPADPRPCTVLDPFTGSGTTGVVALSLGRAFIGCELNPQYHLLACERVKAAAIGMPLREMRGGQGSLFESTTEEESA